MACPCGRMKGIRSSSRNRHCCRMWILISRLMMRGGRGFSRVNMGMRFVSSPFTPRNTKYTIQRRSINLLKNHIEFAGCVSHGNSGGPLFAWFTSGPCVGACVIGVVSGDDCLGIDDDNFTRRCGNYAAGGIDMVNLIKDMRRDFP